MKRKIYKGGVDNYPLWWYGQSNRLQNFGDRPNFLTPHGAVFRGNGYYFDGSSGYLEDIYGRHLIGEKTRGVWSQIYLTESVVPPCGSAVGTGNKLYLTYDQNPIITGKIILYSRFCPNLSYLFFPNNQISILDVSQITGLTYLSCHDTLISTLDISQLTGLTLFYCYNTKISTLDVSQNYQIITLKCYDNLMDQSAVDNVLCDANSWNTSDGTLDISGNTAPSSTGTDCANEMTNRNWTVTTD